MDIWIDLDNSPHVPFFAPIIQALERRGRSVLVTARDCFQVCELANLLGVRYDRVGRHFGKYKAMKAVGLVCRAGQLLPSVLRHRPAVAVSHGSRAQLLVCASLRIPSMVIMDYEFVKGLKWTKPQWLMIPELMPASATDFDLKRILTYPGIKEDVYVSTFKPKSEIEADAPCNGQKTLAVIRPPATEAHYHVPESDQMFHDIVEFLDRHSDVSMVILPRNQKQESAIRKSYAHMLERGKITIPSSAINGLDLIWRSDLVISGGGTMNREAAAMGVPVYSIFRGTIGAVDRYLAREGRLTMLESAQDIRSKLIVKPRSRGAIARSANARTLDAIVGQIDSAWETTKSGRAVGQ